MPRAVSDGPSVSLSFANNFWGKDDAGVDPLLDRMHAAKVTGDELKNFYSTRASIEDEYARKLLSLARKPLGSLEGGTLRMSLDVLRGEVEAMGKAHQHVALQMKTELDEQLSAFHGGIKERRKIIQHGVEKLLKTKNQQTATVNKTRDRYEQDCLKIKGYLAQGHMVMGQEERKNKAKLEKTQIQLSTTSNEYEAAVKVLEETTGRWNREWKAACDKFQDLEEERIDFMKSSLWSFANIASTVCVSDDGSCEKVRLSLEDCDVEKDITNFIKEYGTGQEIPDPPKFINFCREDVDENFSDMHEENNYSVAQFQRTMNPAFRSPSPQPSTLESHHDPQNVLRDISHETAASSPSVTPRKNVGSAQPTPNQPAQSRQAPIAMPNRDDFPEVPHNEYPMDGMTQFCRTGPPSDLSSATSNYRPSSRDSQSEISNPTSYSSQEPSVVSQVSHVSQPPLMQSSSEVGSSISVADEGQKKKSGLFQNNSPFRRKSRSDKDRPKVTVNVTPTKTSTWVSGGSNNQNERQPPNYAHKRPDGQANRSAPSASPEPVDPRAKFQLNVGSNVFDVASPDDNRKAHDQNLRGIRDSNDPIAQALAELKGVTKQSSVRMSADRYHGISTPAPGQTPGQTPGHSSNGIPHGQRAGTSPARSVSPAPERSAPPPLYQQPAVSRLGAPEPAFTSRQMQKTTQRYVGQKQNMFNSPSTTSVRDYAQASTNGTSQPRPDARQSAEARRNSGDAALRTNTTTTPAPVSSAAPRSRATSPAPYRSTSPRPGYQEENTSRRTPVPRALSPGPQQGQNAQQSQQQQSYRAPPPSQQQQQQQQRPRAQSNSPVKPRVGNYNTGYSSSQGNSSGYQGGPMPRAVSPQPQFGRPPPQQQQQHDNHSNMALQLAPGPEESSLTHHNPYGNAPQMRGRPGPGYGAGRPMSQYGGMSGGYAGGQPRDNRIRSKSASDGRQYTRDGRYILHHARAMYMYTAAIPEELSFAKGDILAVLRLQDDGWWEAEVVGKNEGPGLVPSNYLQVC